MPCRAMLCLAVVFLLLQLLTKVMDNAITIPVIKKKFGLDAMLGLIPYAGNAGSSTGCPSQ